MLQTFNFTNVRQIDAAGSFLRYETETAGAVDASVRIRIDGLDIGTYLPGDSIELPTRFARVEIEPIAGAQGTIRVGAGRVQSSRVTLGGSVNTNNQYGPRSDFANAAATVGTVNAVIGAAKATRKYLLIQNNSPSGTIYVRFGAAATIGTGIKIGPGGYWEWNAAVPTNDVHAIGDAAGIPVVIVEG